MNTKNSSGKIKNPKRTTITFDNDFLTQLDQHINSSTSYKSRAEYVREAIREKVNREGGSI